MDPLVARPNGVEALEELRDTLDEQEERGEGDHELERPHDRPPGAGVRGLADLERVIGLLPAEVEEEDHRREEEEEVPDRVDLVLAADGPARIEHVGAHVADPHEGIGGPQHEVRAVEHVDHVVGPDGGRAEEVAGHDLPGDGDGHGDDEPCDGPSGVARETVDQLDRGPEGRRRVAMVGFYWGSRRHMAPLLFASVERRPQGRGGPWVGRAVRPNARDGEAADRPAVPGPAHWSATSARSCPCSSAPR